MGWTAPVTLMVPQQPSTDQRTGQLHIQIMCMHKANKLCKMSQQQHEGSYRLVPKSQISQSILPADVPVTWSMFLITAVHIEAACKWISIEKSLSLGNQPGISWGVVRQSVFGDNWLKGSPNSPNPQHPITNEPTEHFNCRVADLK